MSEKGHEFMVTARKKEVSQVLLNSYKIPFTDRGSGSNSILGKLLYLPKANMLLYKHAKKFRPDLFLSFASPYAAQVSSILKIPHIALDDTEHARLGQIMYRPFTEIILSPNCYRGKIARNQQLFNGYMELSYLHPKYFKPDQSIRKLLGVSEDEKFVLLRFVSWQATHDAGHSGISLKNKRRAVEEFSKYAKVFISSETELPDDLEQYRISIPPVRMHDVLSFATLFFGESATMASESAVLGTPAIYLDNDGRGYTDDLEKSYGLVHNFTESPNDQKESIEIGLLLLKDELLAKKSSLQRTRLLKDKIDVTDFLVNFVKEYMSAKD